MNDRIDSIDILTGFAVLGILIMNISSFAMPSMAYFSPFVYDVNLLNHIIYSITHIIADQKFMAIFSMLFGASTLLFTNSVKRSGKSPFISFYNRNFWLLIVGFIHSTYFWYGDVLFIYALCAFSLFFFKSISPKKQFILGILIYLIPTFSNYAINEYVLDHLDAEDQRQIKLHWNPEDEVLQEELETYRGSYEEQIKHREKMTSGGDGFGEAIIGLSFLIDLFTRSFGMMLIGMACFSLGVFSNTLSKQLYKKLMIYGFGIGFPLSVIGLFLAYFFNWDWKYIQFLGRSPNHIATPFIAFGYIGFIMLWIQRGSFKKFQLKLRSIGRTALTAYLAQTFIATIIFYGFGFGLFGYVNRLVQLLIMFLIWILLLSLCPMWLSKYHYGPAEWIWRMLTKMKLVPLKKQNK